MRLLRKIRQALVVEGKLKKYFFYVIGEILLVMIGILLALQVNNWNEKQIEAEKEHKILSDLIEEFKLTKQRIEEKQRLRLSIVPKLESYVQALSNGNASYTSFNNFHAEEYVIGITNPSKGVIDAMISSGELALISNDSLKYLLADWKDQIGNLKENEQILWDVTIDYTDYLQMHIIATQLEWHDWDKRRFEQSFNQLQGKIPYINKLMSFDGCNKIVISECQTVLDSLEEIMKLLKSELKK